MGGVMYTLLTSRSRSSSVPAQAGLTGATPSAATDSTVLLPHLTAPQLRAAATLLDPELMANAPPEGSFLPGVKNPCWLDAKTKTTHCLPYVYVTGTFQAGAAGLYAKLTKHKRIVQSPESRWQFWGEDYKKAEVWISKMDKAVPQVVAAPAANVLIDGSLSTFGFYWSAGIRTHRAFQAIIVPCHRNCSELHHATPARDTCLAEACYPNARANDLKVAASVGGEVHVPMLMAAMYGERKPKLIVVLRNPLERLHSAFWGYAHYRDKYGATPEGFLAYLREQMGAMHACEARGFTMRECALYFEALGAVEEKIFFHCDQIIRGMYSVFLEVWLHYFGDNVLVVRSDDYFADPTATLHRVFRHLGFDAGDLDDAARKQMAEAGQPEASGRLGRALLPEARQLVMDFYRPYNEALARLTGDKRFLEWNQSPAVVGAAAVVGAVARSRRF